MNCKQTRDILLTDYVDGCCAPEIRDAVDGHLDMCAECRQLHELIRLRAVEPFVDAPLEEVDPAVWQRIHEKIKGRRTVDPAEIAGNFWRGIKERFLFPAPAMAWSLVILLGVYSLLNSSNPRVLVEQENKEPSVLVLAELIEGDNGAEDYGTLIEQYFL